MRNVFFPFIFSLDEHLNRGTHFQWMPARSGGDPNFEVHVSNHGGSVSCWGAILGNGKLYVDFHPQGARVNGVMYRKVLVKFCQWLSAQEGCKAGQLKARGFVFQQDRATCHTTAPVLKYLSSKFGTLVSRRPKQHAELNLGGTVMLHWPSHSPDISSLDHYLWERLKNLVFAYPPPNTVKELKEKIKACAPLIDPEELKRGVRATRTWAKKIQEKGGKNIS